MVARREMPADPWVSVANCVTLDAFPGDRLRIQTMQATKFLPAVVRAVIMAGLISVWLPTPMRAADRTTSDRTTSDRTTWNLSTLSQPPKFRWVDETSPIRSLLYSGEPYQGQSTEVFAFYATPATLLGEPAAAKKGFRPPYPAVVLIHGGGGTAFPEWVQLWAKRGYVAISMDLSGHRPVEPKFDPQSGMLSADNKHGGQPRTRLEHPGPDQSHAEKFDSIGGDTSDDWPLHAVSNVIRAHSLIRSFPEVDAQRTAVTGISWGGYTTCLVASVDNRFQAAVPVYGCGFLHEGESVQKPSIDRLDPERRALWIRRYDPSSHLGRCRVPIFFVNGTNDKHYPLDSYLKCYRLVPGPKEIRIEVNMPHSHLSGWRPEEIGLFIDSKLRNTPALPVPGKPKINGNQATVSYQSDLPVRSAKLNFTTDTGPLVARKWQSVPAKVSDGLVTAEKPPENATIWYFTLQDERNAMVSTPVVFAFEANAAEK